MYYALRITSHVLKFKALADAQHFDARAGGRSFAGELVRIGVDHLKGFVMHRNHHLRLEKFHRLRRVVDAHRKIVANRQQRHVNTIHLANKLHVHEQGRIARVINRFATGSYFFEKIREMGFETGPPPQLSVVIYRYTNGIDDPNTFNRQLIKEIHRDGRIFITSTLIDGVFWLRLAVLSFRTHLRHINELLTMLSAARDKLLRN